MLRALERIERMNDGVLLIIILMSISYLNESVKCDSIFIWYVSLIMCIVCATFLIIKHIINIVYLIVCGS